MSLNCQSINSKFEEFRLFIDRINKVEDIGVVCLQETWTSEKDDVSLFHLPNYKLFHKGKTAVVLVDYSCMFMSVLKQRN